MVPRLQLNLDKQQRQQNQEMYAQQNMIVSGSASLFPTSPE